MTHVAKSSGATVAAVLLLAVSLVAGAKPAPYTIYTDRSAFLQAARSVYTETFDLPGAGGYCGDGADLGSTGPYGPNGGTSEISSPDPALAPQSPQWRMLIQPSVLRPNVPDNKFLCVGYDLIWAYPDTPGGNRVLAWTYPWWPYGEYNVVLTLASPTSGIGVDVLTQDHGQRDLWIPELDLRVRLLDVSGLHDFIGVVGKANRKFSTVMLVNTSTDPGDRGISLDNLSIAVPRTNGR